MKRILVLAAIAATLALPGMALGGESGYEEYNNLRRTKTSGHLGTFKPVNLGAPKITNTGGGTRRRGGTTPWEVVPEPVEPEEYCVDTIVCGVPLTDDEVSCVWVEVCGEPVD